MPPPGRHGGRRARGGHGEDHEEGGAERWLVTYADMLTLLLVLFIVLFSISVVNTSKFISLKTSLAAVFGDGTKGMLSGGTGLNENDATGTGNQMVMAGTPEDATPGTTSSTGQTSSTATSGSTGPAGMAHWKSPLKAGGYTAQDVQHEVSDFAAIRRAIEASLAAHGLQKTAVKFAITSRGLVITMVTNALVFPGNSADLLAEGQAILASVAPPLAAGHRMIEVDGYTNQENTSTAPYPSGWELSSARASAVVRYLVAHGVAEQRLSAVGMNDLHPLYPKSDPRSITQNRRVEIVVLSSLPSTAGDSLAVAGQQH